MPKEHFLHTNTVPLHLGSISAKNARFALSVFKTIQEKLFLSKDKLKEKTFLLAVSGGMDSLAMLAIFACCRQYFGYHLHIAHFNHGIRKESFDEETLLKKICERLNVPYTIARGNTPEYAKQHKMGLEEAGRILRYDFFAKLQKSLQETKTHCLLCTAHHADDLCEDVLMRLIRGTAWPRLGGMDYFDEERMLVRPLLYVQKQELRALIQELEIPHAEDTSNQNITFLRNRVRHTLIPLLEKENPQFHKNILKLRQNAEYDKEHFNKEVNAVLANCHEGDNTIIIPLKQLQQKDKSIRLHCYHALLKKLQQGHAITDTFEKLDIAIMKNHGNTQFKFSNNVRMKISQNALHCSVKE